MLAEMGVELDLPYKLTLAPRPAKRAGEEAGNSLVAFEFNFKPPVDARHPGHAHAEDKPGNKWSLQEVAAETGNPVYFEGTGRRPHKEHLMVWKGTGDGFVLSKLDAIVTFSHKRVEVEARPPVAPSRKTLGIKVAAKKSTTAVTQRPRVRVNSDSNDNAGGGDLVRRRVRQKRRANNEICAVCSRPENTEELLICSSPECGTAEHLYCTFPTLSVRPEVPWFCSSCVEDGQEQAGNI